MRDRWALIQRGLFPETLPPAFTAVDLKRAFRGNVRDVTAKAFPDSTQTNIGSDITIGGKSGFYMLRHVGSAFHCAWKSWNPTQRLRGT